MRCTCRSSATGSLSVAPNRRRSQLVVWNAAPEEERQARGQVQIADPIGRTRSHACRLAFDAKQKAGSREDALESALDTGIEITLAAAGSVKTDQRGEVGVAHRTPIGSRRERRQDLFRARFFRRGVFGPADEDLAAARRISRCGRTGTDRQSTRAPPRDCRGNTRWSSVRIRFAAAAARLRVPRSARRTTRQLRAGRLSPRIRSSRCASAVCMYSSNSGSPCVLPAKFSGVVIPFASPPTVNRFKRTPSSRKSSWCGSPIPMM